MTAILNIINCDSECGPEERFLKELAEYFPKMKFSLINMKLPGQIFGCGERQTLKAGRRKIKLSWSPPISETKHEEYYQRLLNECIGEVEKLYPKRKWF